MRGVLLCQAHSAGAAAEKNVETNTKQLSESVLWRGVGYPQVCEATVQPSIRYLGIISCTALQVCVQGQTNHFMKSWN